MRSARWLAVLAALALLAGGCMDTAQPGPTSEPTASPQPSPSDRPGDFIDVEGVGKTRVDVQRPMTSDTACEPAMPAAQTIAERVAAFRAMGFFADRSALSDDELAAEVEQGIVDLYGNSIDLQSFLDLLVLEQDERRTWWRDLEADVGRGGEVYALTLDEWAVISAGAFTPGDIVETWASETGPVTLDFTLDGAAHALAPAYLEDWIDPMILEPINDLIAASGRRYTLVQAFDQTGYLMALTADERAALEARGWCFA